MIDLNNLSEQEIQSRLASSWEHNSEEGSISAFLSDAARPAAVLIPLLRAPDNQTGIDSWHILLTKRSSQLAEHSGQVAFPGGRSDPQDLTPEATALREAYEEIGLEPAQVHILGQLESLMTITNYCVSPVVAVIPWPFRVRLAPIEVDRVFTIPINWLADPAHFEIRHMVIPPPYSLHFGSESHPVIYFHPYDGEVLWGVSAEITIRLLKVLRQ